MKNAIAKIRFFLIISLVSVGLFSCLPEENFPPETVLEFQGVRFVTIVDGNLEFPGMIVDIGFQDGDGNLGNLPSDTVPNLFVHVFDVRQDTVVPMLTIDEVDPEYWVKTFVVPDLGRGSVSGTFNIGFFSDFEWLQRAVEGVVRFKIYIYDRDLTGSNEVITPNININVSQ